MFDSANKYDLQSAVELSNKKMFDKYNSDPDNSEFSRDSAGEHGLETYTKVFGGASLEEIYKFAQNNKQFRESLDFISMYESEKGKVKQETKKETKKLKSEVKKEKAKEEKKDQVEVIGIKTQKINKAQDIPKNEIGKLDGKSYREMLENQWGSEEESENWEDDWDEKLKDFNEEKFNLDESSGIKLKRVPDGENLIDLKYEFDNLKDDEIGKTETLENLGTFFNIDLIKLNNKIKENGLSLDLVKFLSEYKLYIETNLANFEYKNKIIESISKRIQKLDNIIDERIAWVDKQIEEQDYRPEDRAQEIQNQRWIINSHIQELFSEINNKVIPSAYLIANKKGNVGDSSERESMFQAELTEDGDFDKSIWTGEAYDAMTDNWNILDASDEDDRKKLENSGVKLIDTPSILNEEDIEIEKKVESYYIGYVLLSMVPYLGAGLAIPSDIADLVSDEEGVSKILRGMGIIHEDYRMEKTMLDNILGGVGIVLSIFGLQAFSRAKKGEKAFSLAKGFTPSEIKKSISELGELMNLPKEKINKALSFLKDSGKGAKNFDKSKTTDTTHYILEGKTYRWSEKQQKYIGKKGEMYDIDEFEKLQIEKAPKLEFKKVETKKRSTESNKEATKTKVIKEQSSKNENFDNLLASNPLNFVNKQFREIFDNYLKNQKSIELKNSKGEKIKISKTDDGKFRINDSNQTYTKKQMLGKIDADYRKNTIKEKALSDIKNLSGKEKITLAKTFGLPGTGKVEILKGGEVRLNGKTLSEERVKQLFRNEKFVKEVIKKDLDNITNNIISKLVSKEKREELMKAGVLDIFKGLLKRNIITNFTMIGAPFLLDDVFGFDTGSETLDIGMEVGGELMAGYIVGTILNIVLKVPTRGISKIGGTLWASIDGHKFKIVGTALLGLLGYNVYNEIQESNKNTQ